MVVDFVFPNNNEDEFINNAIKLGYTQLYLIYKYHNKIDYNKLNSQVKDLNKKYDIKLSLGISSDYRDYQKARKLTRVIFYNSKEQTPEQVRKIIEDRNPPFMIYNLSFQKRDFIHHKNSGLNQVTSKLLVKRKISVGFSFSLILYTKSSFYILGRMFQNIRLARKFKFKTNICSFAKSPSDMRYYHDLAALFLTIGMHNKDVKESFEL